MFYDYWCYVYICVCDVCSVVFFFNDTATTEIYTYCHTLSLHDALPICRLLPVPASAVVACGKFARQHFDVVYRPAVVEWGLDERSSRYRQGTSKSGPR